jgi:hypothetical protein
MLSTLSLYTEGAITVREFDSVLTPLGEVMALYGHHQTNTRVVLPSDNETSADLDFTASVGKTGSKTADKGQGRVLLLHVANRNAVQGYSLALQLHGMQRMSRSPAAHSAKFTLLTPTQSALTPSTMFAKTTGDMQVQTDGKLQLHIPPYGVMEISVLM